MNNDIIKSFIPQKELNPKVWVSPEGNPKDSDGQELKLKPEIRNRLLEIAYEFIEFLDVDIIVTDIILTGSLANYNWSKYSDFDLHIVANFQQYDESQIDLYEKLFTLKKMIFNDKHDIRIKGYEVELYVQNETETHFSSGVYSILFDEWANNPKKENVEIDKKLILSKAREWMKNIDTLIDSIDDDDLETAKNIVKKYKDKLKKFRTSGLEKNGEYSVENLVFKILRRNGYIEKLHNKSVELIDKKLSMNQ
jgi:predicted nucleotidyltransferase